MILFLYLEELWLLRVACKVATPLIAWLFLLGISSDIYREGSLNLLFLYLTSLNLGSHFALGWRGECCGSSGGSCFCASSGGSCLSTFFKKESSWDLSFGSWELSRFALCTRACESGRKVHGILCLDHCIVELRTPAMPVGVGGGKEGGVR